MLFDPSINCLESLDTQVAYSCTLRLILSASLHLCITARIPPLLLHVPCVLRVCLANLTGTAVSVEASRSDRPRSQGEVPLNPSAVSQHIGEVAFPTHAPVRLPSLTICREVMLWVHLAFETQVLRGMLGGHTQHADCAPRHRTHRVLRV